MAWLSQFLLGRPGYEYLFEINPAGMDITEQPVEVIQENLNGDMLMSLIKASKPVIKINSNYFSKTQRDQFASLTGLPDTFLSFQTRDDWQRIAEYNWPITTTTVQIQNTSASKLSQALALLDLPGIITINSVVVGSPIIQGGFGAGGFGSGAFGGADFFAGGSYNDATRTVTLGTALLNLNSPVYITYTYKGWLVKINKLPFKSQGGWIDKFTYDFELQGV